MGGLTAAGALADHFDKSAPIERPRRRRRLGTRDRRSSWAARAESRAPSEWSWALHKGSSGMLFTAGAPLPMVPALQ